MSDIAEFLISIKDTNWIAKSNNSEDFSGEYLARIIRFGEDDIDVFILHSNNPIILNIKLHFFVRDIQDACSTNRYFVVYLNIGNNGLTNIYPVYFGDAPPIDGFVKVNNSNLVFRSSIPINDSLKLKKG